MANEPAGPPGDFEKIGPGLIADDTSFTTVRYANRDVSVYASWSNDRTFKSQPERWMFLYQPVFLPELDETTNLPKLRRTEGNKEIRLKIWMDPPDLRGIALGQVRARLLKSTDPTAAAKIDDSNVRMLPVRRLRINWDGLKTLRDVTFNDQFDLFVQRSFVDLVFSLKKEG